MPGDRRLPPLVKAGQVFFDLAKLELIEGLAKLLNHVPVERILFGSDYPWGAQNVSWEKTKVTSAPISFSDKKRILHENARELLNL